MYICQIGNGYMLYVSDIEKYPEYATVVKTGYPYPDIDKVNDSVKNQVDNLYSYFNISDETKVAIKSLSGIEDISYDDYISKNLYSVIIYSIMSLVNYEVIQIDKTYNILKFVENDHTKDYEIAVTDNLIINIYNNYLGCNMTNASLVKIKAFSKNLGLARYKDSNLRANSLVITNTELSLLGVIGGMVFEDGVIKLNKEIIYGDVYKFFAKDKKRDISEVLEEFFIINKDLIFKTLNIEEDVPVKIE